MRVARRDFLKISGAGVAASHSSKGAATGKEDETNRMAVRAYNQVYSGPYLNRVAFPIGGIGAGMLCLVSLIWQFQRWALLSF